MGTVIHVNFSRNNYSLKQARVFLGSGLFRKALLEWDLKELERTVLIARTCPTEAWDAYSAVFRFREKRENDRRIKNLIRRLI